MVVSGSDRASGRRPRRFVAALTVVGVLVFGSACGSDDDTSRSNGGQKSEQQAGAPTVTVAEPATGAKDVPTSAELVFNGTASTAPTVEVKDEAGKAVKGALQADGKTWLPSGQLDYGTTYTATVTAPAADGKPATATSTFTTMSEPDNQVQVSSFLGDGQVVGVGMPLIVRFGREIPSDQRDDVQRRMTVQATPPQEGIWHWVSGIEVHFRPKQYWHANSKIHYKLQTGGLPMGGGWYGSNDLTVDVRTSRALVMTVDNQSKSMTVTRDGKVVKTIPVSLGKPSTPSSSGTMVVIEKKRKTVFDTLAELGPKEGYRTKIDYAQRLTWGGEFIHAAPWSEGVQGKVNVSHGCVNVSMAMGDWLFDQTMIGDPITVKGTGQALQNGNGWTDWNMSWDEYVKGSAVPVGA